MSLAVDDVSVVTSRRLEEDEDLGLTLDNAHFDRSQVRKGTVRGVDGAFVLTNCMTKEGTRHVRLQLISQSVPW